MVREGQAADGADIGRQSNRVSGDCLRARIELQGRQTSVVDIEQVSILRGIGIGCGEDSAGLAFEKAAIRGRLQPAHVHPRRFGAIVLLVEDEMFTVGKELRPQVAALAFGFIQLDYRLRLAAGGRHTVEAIGKAGREEDGAIGVPCAAAWGGFRLADHFGGAAGDAHLVQILAAEESDHLAIR